MLTPPRARRWALLAVALGIASPPNCKARPLASEPPAEAGSGSGSGSVDERATPALDAHRVIEALRKGEWHVVRAWLDGGADPRRPLDDDHRTALHLVAENPKADLALARRLLDAGVSPGATADDGTTPLHAAAGAGNLELVKLLEQRGAELRATDRSGKNALHYAAHAGAAPLVTYLVGRGLPVDGADDKGRAALQIAAETGDVATIRALLDARADPRRVDERGFDAMGVAIVYGENPEVVEELLRRGVPADGTDSGSPYLHVAVRACNAKAAELLLRNGARVAARDSDGTTLWNVLVAGDAGECQDPDTVRLLLERGMPVDGVKDAEGRTYLLHLAADPHGGDALAVAKLLLEHRADPNARGRDGTTPLWAAVENGDDALVKLLLAHGADLRARRPRGPALLKLAIQKGDAATLQALLDAAAARGVDLGQRGALFDALPPRLERPREDVLVALLRAGASAAGRSAVGAPAMAAYLQGGMGVSAEVLKLLLARGADARAKDRSGASPLLLAIDHGVRKDAIDVLLRAGASMQERDAQGRTPLLRALEHDRDPEDLADLLARGADLGARDASGRTAIMLAARSQRPEVVKFLLERGADPLAVSNAGQDAIDVATDVDHRTVAEIVPFVERRFLVRRVDRPLAPESGRQTVTWPGGDRYEGPVEEGRPHGSGVCTVAGKREPCTYEHGERLVVSHLYDRGNAWSGGIAISVGDAEVRRRPVGSGTMRWMGGDVYEGPLGDGGPVQGTFRWAHLDGAFRGPHVGGIPEGAGTCTRGGVSSPCTCVKGWPLRPGDQEIPLELGGWRGRGTYVGPVRDGKPNGFGMWRSSDGGEVYWGGWRDGKRHGQGIFLTPHDTVYRGAWVHGVRQGKGVCFTVSDPRERPCVYAEDHETSEP